MCSACKQDRHAPSAFTVKCLPFQAGLARPLSLHRNVTQKCPRSGAASSALPCTMECMQTDGLPPPSPAIIVQYCGCPSCGSGTAGVANGSPGPASHTHGHVHTCPDAHWRHSLQ